MPCIPFAVKAGAVASRLAAGEFNQQIDGGNGDLVIVALGIMGGAEQAAEFDEIAGFQRAYGVEDAGVFGDDMAGAAVEGFGELCDARQVGEAEVAQLADTK